MDATVLVIHLNSSESKTANPQGRSDLPRWVEGCEGRADRPGTVQTRGKWPLRMLFAALTVAAVGLKLHSAAADLDFRGDLVRERDRTGVDLWVGAIR